MPACRFAVQLVRFVVVLVAAFLLPRAALAQHGAQPMCQEGCGGGGDPVYSVVVTPDAEQVYWVPVHTSNQHVTFMVYNTGNITDTYTLSCSAATGLTCVSVSPSSVTIANGDSASVSVHFDVGAIPTLLPVSLAAQSDNSDLGYDTGSYNVEVVDPPAVTLVVPGSGARAVVHNRQPIVRSTFLPTASVIDTTQTVLTFRGDTVTPLARHNRGLIEWEVDSTHWLRTGLPSYSGVDSGLVSIRVCGLQGYCDTQTRWLVLPADSTPVLGFTGMPLENLGGGFSSGFGPGLSVSGAEVETGFSVPSYVSMGVPRSAGLVYSTRQSYPRALVHVDLDLPWPTTTPSQVKLILSDGGTHLDSLTLTGSAASCLTGSIRRCRATLQADFAAGTYATPTRKWLAVEAQVTSGAVMKSSTDSVEVVVVDRRATHYGSGWWPAGLSQVVAAGQDRVLVGSTGTATVYRGNGDSVYVPSPGNFTALVKTANGWELQPRGSTAKTLFDTNGRLVGTVDVNSNRDTVIYNGSGDVTTLTDPVGKSLTFAYDGTGHLASITDPGGRVSRMRVTSLTNKLSSDSMAAPAARHDTTYFRYQTYPGTFTMALVSRLGVLAGDSTRVVYDSTFTRRPVQVVLAKVHDETGAEVQPTITYGAYERRGMGALASLDSVYVEMKDPRNNWTRSLLNRWGESRKTWDNLGVIGQSDYAPDGRVNWTQGKNGDTTRVYHAYDAASRLVRSYVLRYDVSPNYLRLDSLVYDAQHRVIKRIDAPGHVTQFFYDALGRDTLTIAPDLTASHVWYRADGLPDSTLAPLESRATHYIYEATWKNLYRALDASGDTLTTNTYDTFGRLTRADRKIAVMLTSTTDTSQWRRTETFYNDANQVDSTALSMSQRCKPVGGNCNPLWELIATTRQRYDVAGRDTGTTNNMGVTATYHYDLLGRVLASRPWADSVAVKDSMTYDVAGNLKLAVTRRGTTITHAYDSRNRDTLTTMPGVGDLHSAYAGPQDQLTRLWYTSVVDSIGGVNGELRWAFDRLGRMVTDTSYTGSVVRVGTHAYDLYERPSTLTDALGTWTTKYETTRGLPDSLITPYADTVEFIIDGQGRPAATIVQSGLAQRATIAASWGAGGKLLELYNTVAPAAGLEYYTGRLTRPYATDTSAIPLAPTWSTQHVSADTVDRAERDSLQYDALERLTRWVRVKAGTQVGSETYDFDGNDNVSQSTGAATYDVTTDRLRTRVNGAAVDSFAYDRAGNLTRLHEAAGPTWDYGYDPLDRLASVRRNGTLIARYAYDVAGRRIVKRVYSSASGGTVGYLRMSYRGDEVAFETDSAGSTIGLRYEWGQGTDQLLAVRDAAGHHFYPARDQLGSIRTLSTRDGTWLRSERFSPYGTSVDVDSAATGVGIALRYGWTGREYDAETGFYFLRARYYSPSLRRFVQADPIGTSGGNNVYAYAAGNPLEVSDPSGLQPKDAWLAAQSGPNPVCIVSYCHTDSSDPTAWNWGVGILDEWAPRVFMKRGISGDLDAYKKGKADMQLCASGVNCDPVHAADAAAGLKVLNAAEADPSVSIIFSVDMTSAPGVPARGTYASFTASITLYPSDPSVGTFFMISAVAVHEAYESYVRLLAAGGANNPNTFGPAGPAAHAAAVRYAEDTSLLGSGLQTRTSRSLHCNIEPTPQAFGHQACF